jgi:hypothetical protein
VEKNILFGTVSMSQNTSKQENVEEMSKVRLFYCLELTFLGKFRGSTYAIAATNGIEGIQDN